MFWVPDDVLSGREVYTGRQNVPTFILRWLVLPTQLLLNAQSRGYKQATEGRRASKSLMCG